MTGIDLISTSKYSLMVGSKRYNGLDSSLLGNPSEADILSRHVAPDSLKTYKYHGSSKDVAADSILEYDVVVTTYATIVSEVAKRSSLLHQLMWFRIVLDEGMRHRE